MLDRVEDDPLVREPAFLAEACGVLTCGLERHLSEPDVGGGDGLLRDARDRDVGEAGDRDAHGLNLSCSRMTLHRTGAEDEHEGRPPEGDDGPAAEEVDRVGECGLTEGDGLAGGVGELHGPSIPRSSVTLHSVVDEPTEEPGTAQAREEDRAEEVKDLVDGVVFHGLILPRPSRALHPFVVPSPGRGEGLSDSGWGNNHPLSPGLSQCHVVTSELVRGDPGDLAPGVLDARLGRPLAPVLGGTRPEELAGEAVHRHGRALGRELGEEGLRLRLGGAVLRGFLGSLLGGLGLFRLTGGLANRGFRLRLELLRGEVGLVELPVLQHLRATPEELRVEGILTGTERVAAAVRVEVGTVHAAELLVGLEVTDVLLVVLLVVLRHCLVREEEREAEAVVVGRGEATGTHPHGGVGAVGGAVVRVVERVGPVAGLDRVLHLEDPPHVHVHLLVGVHRVAGGVLVVGGLRDGHRNLRGMF